MLLGSVAPLVTSRPNAGTSKHSGLWRGLVGAWSASLGTLEDLSGYRRNGTDNGSVIYGDGAVTFGGTASDYVSTGNWGNAYPVITVFARVKPSGTGRGDIVTKWQTGSPQQYRYNLLQGVSPGFWDFYVSNGSTIKNARSTTSITAGRWYTIAGSYDGTSIKIYVNGKLEATTTHAGTLPTVTSQDRIGNSYDAYYSGSLSEVYIFGRLLDAREHRTLAADSRAPLRRRSLSLLVPGLGGGGGHTVTALSATHAQTAGTTTLTQTHGVSATSVVHALTVQSAPLSQTHVVAATGAEHTHTVDTANVTQTHVVAATSAEHSHTAGTATVSQVVTVAALGATHGHTAGAGTLTQQHVVSASSALHGLTSAAAAVAQTHVVAAASAIHSHTADTVTVTLSAAVAASQFWVCIGLEGWFSDRVGIEGWLAVTLGLEGHVATAKGIE